MSGNADECDILTQPLWRQANLSVSTLSLTSGLGDDASVSNNNEIINKPAMIAPTTIIQSSAPDHLISMSDAKRFLSYL